MAADTHHRAFKQPDDPDIPIWRYVSLAKFVDLIRTRSLYFCRIDQLADKYEGTWPKRNPDDSEGHKKYKNFSDLISTFTWFARNQYVNCWCAQQHESDALWRIYGAPNDGVAIQTTYAKLCDSLPYSVNAGIVTYVDYEKDIIPTDNALYLCAHKRHHFDWEHEIRFVYYPEKENELDCECNASGTAFYTEPPSAKCGQCGAVTILPVGRSVSIDLSSAIRSIVAAPGSGSWFIDCVADLVTRYGVKAEVKRSGME